MDHKKSFGKIVRNINQFIKYQLKEHEVSELKFEEPL